MLWMQSTGLERICRFAEAPVVIVSIKQVDSRGDYVSTAYYMWEAPILLFSVEQVWHRGLGASALGSSAVAKLF